MAAVVDQAGMDLKNTAAILLQKARQDKETSRTLAKADRILTRRIKTLCISGANEDACDHSCENLHVH